MSLEHNKVRNNFIVEIGNEYHTPKSAKELVARTRDVFRSQKTKPIEFRKKQLKNFQMFLLKEEVALCKAVREDLNKPEAETISYEILIPLMDLREVLNKIDGWVKPEHVKKTIVNTFDDLYIFSDPLGVVLVIGAWNYPIHLTLAPVIGEFEFVFFYIKWNYEQI